jgi:hypothetical protein
LHLDLVKRLDGPPVEVGANVLGHVTTNAAP